MKRDNNAAFWFSVIVGPLIGGFLAYFVSASVLKEFSWCVAGEDHCVREWVDALSGWAAFIGAIIALPYLAAQVREAIRQTEYTVGDAAPEFLVHRNRTAKRFTITVRNWNRRRVMVDDISLIGSSTVTVYDIADAKDPAKPSRLTQLAGGDNGSFGVDGWIDRNVKPASRQLQLTFAENAVPINDPTVFASGMTLLVNYRILGQRHERRTEVVSALDIQAD